MKQLFVIVFFMVIGLIGYCQANAVRGHQFRLTGKLAEKVQLTPHCGTIAWGTVVQFEVIGIEGMIYPNKRIAIIVTCPEFYKDNFFKKGKTYEVVFSDKNQANFGWVIPNKDLLKRNGLSFEPYAVTVKKMP